MRSRRNCFRRNIPAQGKLRTLRQPRKLRENTSVRLYNKLSHKQKFPCCRRNCYLFQFQCYSKCYLQYPLMKLKQNLNPMLSPKQKDCKGRLLKAYLQNQN